MFVLEPVAARESVVYRNFSFPYHRPLLDALAQERRADVVAIGASLLGDPAGLALAQVSGGAPKAAQLHSIVVTAAHRKSGIGEALLSSVESEARSRGCEFLHGVFMAGGESSAATEALLRKNQWSEPHPRRLICESDVEHIRRAAWLSGPKLPAGYSVFPWAELSARERCAVADREGTPGWHSHVLNPFPDEPLEPAMSLGLRYKSEVIGWAIWTVLDESRVRGARLFVRRDLQRLGRGIALLARSIERMNETKRTRAIFDVAIQNENMVKFVRRRLAPYLTSLRETRGSWKRL
jgi:GNAT superfamily N-acetyltransferase